MENPLNRSFIGYNADKREFYVVNPASVDWNQYFKTDLYPNVVDSIENWAELNLEGKGDHGEGDTDKKLPTVSEVGTWPVTFIRYPGAQAFADFYGYDLPTKAQWQYAARGGRDFAYATSDGSGERGSAWINFDGPFKIHKGHPQPAKSKNPNPYGLYNLGGNVWEWVQDWYKGTQVFFKAKKDEEFFLDDKVTYQEARGQYLKGILGGSFNFFPRVMQTNWNHAAMPFAGNDHFGFRVVRNAKWVEGSTSSRESPNGPNMGATLSVLSIVPFA
jgi:formylglycine-generating enzyme required for sulfatase activity